MTLERRRDFAVLAALCSLSLATSVLLDCGLVCSNDGSHYALILALAEDHSPVIDRFVSYTYDTDLSWKGGLYYSSRPPGTALLALPWYVAGKAAGASGKQLETIVVLLPALLGALAVGLVFATGRKLGLGRSAAAVGALALALCTPHRTYSSSLWSHAPSAFFDVLALWLTLLVLEEPALETARARRLLLSLGLACGYGVVVDPSAAVSGSVICLAAAGAAFKKGPSLAARARALCPLAAGLALGVLPGMIYSAVAFGSPFALANRYDVHWASSRTISTMYAGPFADGFVGLLFRPEAGLLLYSPVLVLAFWAVPSMWRQIGTRRAAAVVFPPLAMLLLTSKHGTWHGGAAHDVRYLMLVMPLFCLPLGFFYSSARRSRAGTGNGAALAIFWGLFYLSALIQIGKHAVGWMRSATPFVLQILDAASKSGPVHAGAFLAWLFPHPLAAAAILACGAAGAAVLWPREQTQPEELSDLVRYSEG
jgi:hypothetical protein